MRPEIYEPNEINECRQITVQEIWNKDNNRKDIIISKLPENCLYIVIWESEYKNDPEGTVNKVVKQIKNHKNNI